MENPFKLDPFAGPSRIPGLETFDPFGETSAATAAGLYYDGCEPPIIINTNCPCAAE